MARYNTITTTTSTSGATTFSTPTQGLLTTLTGTAPYTVTLASPGLYTGATQSFYNNTNGVITLSTPSGNIVGPGFTAATTQTIPQFGTYTLTSDGTNYVITNNEGGPQVATTYTISSTATFNGTVTASPANASVTMSPTGTGTVTMAPATTGTINNMNIGATTRGSVACTTLDANGNVTLGDATADTITLNGNMTGGLGSIDGGTF